MSNRGEVQDLKYKLNWLEDALYPCIDILNEFEELNPALTKQQYAKLKELVETIHYNTLH